MLYPLLITLFVIAVLLQCGYALLFYKGAAIKPAASLPVLPGLSIVICAKNEAPQLERFLPAVLEQDYPAPGFEVIVVNDTSTDASAALLETFSARYPQLRVITLSPGTPRTWPGKKFALQQGIAAAKQDLVLLTDADCRPAGPLWARTMVAAQEKGSGKPLLVLGYGAYEYRPGLLNRFIHWETAHTHMQYASYARAGKTYMGVGRNMLYSKSLPAMAFGDPGFSATYAATPSGDDDLLVSAIAPHAAVACCLAGEAHTVSVAQDTWRKWWRQKTRHASTGKYYRKDIRQMLGLYGLSHSLYWFMGLLLLTLGGPAAAVVLALFLFRLMIYWILAGKWYRVLNEKKLLIFYPLGDLGWAIYNVFLSPFIFWKNKQTWK